MAGGKYLTPEERSRLVRDRQRRKHQRIRRKVELMLMLICETTFVVYMIAGGHLDGSFGAGLAAVLSAYFGYQLKGV